MYRRKLTLRIACTLAIRLKVRANNIGRAHQYPARSSRVCTREDIREGTLFPRDSDDNKLRKEGRLRET